MPTLVSVWISLGGAKAGVPEHSRGCVPMPPVQGRERVVYVATEIATELAGTNGEGNR
jgi:hypothetical protein